MHSGTVLLVDRDRNSVCPWCNRSYKIECDPETGGYRFPTHHPLITGIVQPGQNCEGSNAPVTETELARLASLP